ncbi:MAG: four helix bundle protein [Candidatus Zambryskibacteria bacterium CG11_big_fil_rev_8_21_14_0_20_40_24]|uniref:Four helix bundle protein n=1 Tax=Candidatus Zambryskibacteria bacterium CG11_big_fil_rev_8_21_14_0_20_40_24 TaxID=1975116 RepID=A0A2H0K9P5_9BACT|nr:MAG: four helix bundle protein [Candidatus Zambryskibacteria bacterium CG11_big_fil_rev_8_21_14_0_20_40_24]
MMKIQSFKDPGTWKEGHKLVLMVYKITRTFPKDELFALTNQMIRAVVSVTSNIAEGFGRSSYKDKNHFYQMALGSIIEIQNQLMIAKDVQYIGASDFEKINDQAVKVEFICKGLIRKSKTFYS